LNVSKKAIIIYTTGRNIKSHHHTFWGNYPQVNNHWP